MRFVVILIALATLVWIGKAEQKAKERCLENHSYDTCSYAMR